MRGESWNDALLDSRRLEAVESQMAGRDITSEPVLEAMRRVPRHRFVPASLASHAYADAPLPIGHGQTISQPYIVALQTQLLRPEPHHRALDVGTGSGYQAAVLAELVRHVYSVELVPELAESARERLTELGYGNVSVRCGDGTQGWPEEAPFDLITAAAAARRVPQALVDQLAPGGRLVIPVGELFQELLLIERREDGALTRRSVIPVRFVPLIETDPGSRPE